MAGKRRKITVRVTANGSSKEETVKIRCTSAEKAAWAEAAEKDERGVSTWLRRIANQAAGAR